MMQNSLYILCYNIGSFIYLSSRKTVINIHVDDYSFWTECLFFIFVGGLSSKPSLWTTMPLIIITGSFVVVSVGSWLYSDKW